MTRASRRTSALLTSIALALAAITAVPQAATAAEGATGRVTGGTKVDRGEYDQRWRSIVA